MTNEVSQTGLETESLQEPNGNVVESVGDPASQMAQLPVPQPQNTPVQQPVQGHLR